ncbi:MAG: ABC transporter ATP-binding protein [Ignavibacteriaceae bacterium]|nr:ABC transporter ATP-binding protein [Ignavibacteriaceae bacterium]
MKNAVVQVKNLTHHYGSRLIFENLNFQINQGSIFGLLGKNGTGKTTTINILNGFLEPTSGKCLVFDEDSYKLSPKTKSRVGFLIEGHIQYSFMNIKQIEKYYSGFYPNWKKEAYWELLRKLQVTETQKISKMSCGQRSQIALGLLLAQNPDLLILDDFSMGLDAGYRRLFIDYLTDYIHAEGKTVFITSHIIQDLEDLLDDCVIIDYKSVLMTMPIRDFMSKFKHFRCILENPPSSINKDEIIKNIEIIKNKTSIYTFADEATLLQHLEKLGLKHSGVQQVKMSLEDAFIGLTGKY